MPNSNYLSRVITAESVWEKFEGIYKYLSESEHITQQSKNNIRNEKVLDCYAMAVKIGPFHHKWKKKDVVPPMDSENIIDRTCDKWGSSNEYRN